MRTVFQPDWMEKVVVLVIPPEEYNSISPLLPIEIAKERDMEGVFVSMNKPYNTTVKSRAQSIWCFTSRPKKR